jgi:hypothetical protein
MAENNLEPRIGVETPPSTSLIAWVAVSTV